MHFKYLKLFAIPALLIFSGTANAAEVDSAGNDSSLQISSGDNKDSGKNIELQLEFLSGKHSDRRHVDNYNVHLFKEFKQNGSVTLHYGFTFMRATGYNIPRGKKLDSNAVGLGPAFMLRWRKQLSGKLYGGIDFTGSFLLCNRAHPAEGRAYGFLWRTGPAITWKFNKDNSATLSWLVSHFSNGTRTHNPGYNTMGVSLGIAHRF